MTRSPRNMVFVGPLIDVWSGPILTPGVWVPASSALRGLARILAQAIGSRDPGTSKERLLVKIARTAEACGMKPPSRNTLRRHLDRYSRETRRVFPEAFTQRRRLLP